MFKNIFNNLFKKTLETEDINDQEEEKEWLANQHLKVGFKSYIRGRDLVLLKKIAICMDNRDFQQALELNGQRKEILNLMVACEEEYRKNET